MAAYNPVAFGRALHAHRIKLGWSAIQLSELYAEFVGREDSPPGPTFIYHIEGGTVLIGQARRVILACLVGMPLALAGIAQHDCSMPLDILEYTQALTFYCNQWREGSLKQETGTIEARINQLEAAALQASGAEKSHLLELSGFYRIVHADIWGTQQPAIAHALLSSPIDTAQKEKLSALHVYALTQRARLLMSCFESTGNSDILQPATRDHDEAVKLQDSLPVLNRDLLSIEKGLLDAYVARDKPAFTAALHTIAKGSDSIGATPDERITTRLDEEHCMLTRASAYIYAPMGNAKLGLAQLQELERRSPGPHGKRRQVQRNQLWAEAYLATDHYPMAAAHLEAAVENASQDWIDSLIPIHTRLKNTLYGNDPNMGRVSVKIHQMKHPELFL